VNRSGVLSHLRKHLLDIDEAQPLGLRALEILQAVELAASDPGGERGRHAEGSPAEYHVQKIQKLQVFNSSNAGGDAADQGAADVCFPKQRRESGRSRWSESGH
jgi:hypothetical protein